MSIKDQGDRPGRDPEGPRRGALSRDVLAAAERVAQAARMRERNARLAAAAALSQAATSARDSAAERPSTGDAPVGPVSGA